MMMQASPRETRLFLGRRHDIALLALSLILLVLSANQQSYAPKEGIHTVAHITPADVLLWLGGITLLLPLIEQLSWGRWASGLCSLVLVAAGVLMSHKGHVFVSLLHHADTSHLKGALRAGGPLLLGLYGLARLFRNTRTRELVSSNGHLLEGHRLITTQWPPREVVFLLLIGLLSAVTMILPTDSLSEMISSKDNGQEQLRKAALFLIQMWQHFGIAVSLFLLAFRSERRIRLGVRALLLGAVVAIAVAAEQYVLCLRGQVTPVHVSGLLQSRNAYGGFLCVALPFCLGSLMAARRPAVRAVLGLLLAVGLLTTLSGGAFWCILLGLVVTGFALGKRCGMRCLAGCVVAAALILILLPLNRREVATRFLRLTASRTELASTSEDSSSPPAGVVLKKMYVEWIAGIHMSSQHFWLGVGPGQYQLNIGQYYGEDPNPAVRLEADANNLYFVYLSSLGFAGLAALLQVLLSALGRSWRMTRGRELEGWWGTAEARCLAAGAAGALAGSLAVSLFTVILVRGIGIAVAFLVAFSVFVQPPRPDGNDELATGSAAAPDSPST